MLLSTITLLAENFLMLQMLVNFCCSDSMQQNEFCLTLPAIWSIDWVIGKSGQREIRCSKSSLPPTSRTVTSSEQNHLKHRARPVPQHDTPGLHFASCRVSDLTIVLPQSDPDLFWGGSLEPFAHPTPLSLSNLGLDCPPPHPNLHSLSKS